VRRAICGESRVHKTALLIGLSRYPASLATAVELAQIADRAGCWGVGIGDGQSVHGDVYVAAFASLSKTVSARVATITTNVVTRHWSVHAAAARSLAEVAPDRFVLGLSTGDGAVYRVGLRPQRWADLESTVSQIRDQSPASLTIHIAASGPVGAEVAGRVGDAIILSTGIDAEAARMLTTRARAARAAQGVPKPLEVWAVVPTYITLSRADNASAIDRLMPSIVAFTRFAFSSTFDEKNVPDEFHSFVRQQLAEYTHDHHAGYGDVNPNVHLFDSSPKVRSYLVNRMSLVGTADECARRLMEFGVEAGIDGVWLSCGVPEGLEIARRAAAVVAALN